MSESSIAVAGSVVEVVMPGDIAYAREQAVLADAARALAEQAAGIATAVAQGRYFASYAAGNAATSAGQYFAVFTGGNYSFHVNGNATPVFVMPKVDTSGNMTLSAAQFPLITLERTSVGTWSLGYDGQAGSNSFALRLNGGTSILNASAGGNVGIGLGNIAAAVRFHVKSSGEIARLETTTARGSGAIYLAASDPTGRKWLVGCSGANDDLSIINELNRDVIVGANNIAHWAFTRTGSLEPVTDNAKDIAHPSARAKNLYLVNSPTVTSDERDKDWRELPPEDRAPYAPNFTVGELAAGKRIIAELGFYRWKNELEGPLLCGTRAQKVRDIFADEGLLNDDVSRYGLIKHHEWTDMESGEPRDRYSLDPDQLSMFLIAVQEARIAALEAAA